MTAYYCILLMLKKELEGSFYLRALSQVTSEFLIGYFSEKKKKEKEKPNTKHTKSWANKQMKIGN